MSRETRSISNYQLRPEDYPDAKDIAEVNGLEDSGRPGFLQRVLKARASRILAPAGAAGAAVFGFGFGGNAEADAENTAPPAVVQSVDNLDYLPLPDPDVQTNPQDAGTPTPNPNYIPNEEEPNPAGPPVDPGVVVPGPSDEAGDPGNNPPLPPPPPEPHREFFQVVHKEMFDSNGNLIPEWGIDAPWDQQFRYYVDFNRNMQPDAGEGLQSNLRTGPDGVEVIHDSILGNVEGVSVCIEDTSVDPNVELVTPAVQCADINPASLTVEIQSLVKNKEVTPPPVTPPPPTQPPATPRPTPTQPPFVPTPKVEQPPVVVIPPVVVPPEVLPPTIPEVCVLSDGTQVQLPPEFHAQLVGKDAETIAAMIREFKCQFEGHDAFLHEHDDRMTEQHEEQNEMNTEQHNEILDAVNDHADESNEQHEEQTAILKKIWNGVRNGGHDIWDRIDAGASVVAGAGALALLGGALVARRRLIGRFNRIDDNLAQIRARLEQEPPQPPIQPEPEPQPQPEPTPEPAPEPAPVPGPEPQPEPQGRFTDEQVQNWARVLESFDRVFNTIDELTDAQINRRIRAANMTEDQVNVFRQSIVQAIMSISEDDNEDELNGFSIARLARRLSVRRREINPVDTLRIAQAREQLRVA